MNISALAGNKKKKKAKNSKNFFHSLEAFDFVGWTATSCHACILDKK